MTTQETTPTTTVRAYWFFGDALRDGRPVPADGEWLVHEGPVKMCESGLHASRHPFDALADATGSNLALVDVDDVVEEWSDKLVARRRRIVKRIDATSLLRAYARGEALSVAHLWDMPPVVREYLDTGREDLRLAASDAARAAARAAAWDAARAAARDAAWAAARAAARAAVWDATWGASKQRFAALVDAAFAE